MAQFNPYRPLPKSFWAYDSNTPGCTGCLIIATFFLCFVALVLFSFASGNVSKSKDEPQATIQPLENKHE